MSTVAARKKELRDLLKYLAPGTTIEDLMEDDDSDNEGMGYDVVTTKGGARVVSTANTSSNRQQPQSSLSKMQPQQHTINNAVLSKIRVDDFYDVEGGFGGGNGSGGHKMNQKVLNELREATMSVKGQKSNEIDRSERATTENVMDPRTRMILYKLVNSGILREVNGCVSTGKEANVYYAVGGDGTDAAIKVYKTSILVFKDREQYVAGEFRFQRYCKSNPRKMVRTWAEKEARNLGRLANCGIRAPRVKILRQHVLVMEFVGVDGWPSPRLKEVKFPSATSMDRCYIELCVTIRIMFQSCKLVHGDLSEYNLLFHEGHIVVIDVSQSVEHDHPHAINFLRRDIVNVNAFFRSRGHQNLYTLQDLYTFITTPSDGGRLTLQATRDELTDYLVALREERTSCGTYGPVDSEQAKIDEQVFMQIEVPRSLEGISDMRAPNKEVQGFVEEMLAPADGVSQTKTASSSDDDEGSDDEEDEEGEEREGGVRTQGKLLAEMTKEERKEHKKMVKTANRERRQAKMPKHEKKKATRRVKHK